MNYKYDIIKNKKKFFIASIILIFLIFLFSVFKGVNLDIQFKGGTIITYSYNNELDINEFQKFISEKLKQNVNVQDVKSLTTSKRQLQASFPSSTGFSTEQITDITKDLKTKFNNNDINEEQINNVSPSIGIDFFKKSVYSIFIASILMIIYIAIRFKNIGGVSAGVTSVIALIHDVIIVFGTFIIFGFPIDNNFIAVVLTILGYSINDTIVIYDRVRENKTLLSKSTPLSELMNISINQSLARSINTTISTLIALISICVIALIFNVTSIITFAFPMIIGMISGVYSTIFIAGPLWVTYKDMKKIKNKK